MQQSFAWCFALDYEPGADHTIERPKTYDFWSEYQAPFWPAKQLSWTSSDPFTLEPLTRELFDATPGALDMWSYRRILSRDAHEEGRFASDITLVNWPQMDYWLGPLLGVPATEAAAHLHASRELSLSLLYWMQTEAGYPGLRLRGDVLGTADGLAKAPYIREGRRIRAEFRVLEQHLGVAARGTDERRAVQFADTVGTGSYPIDLHPSTRDQNYVIVWAWPFQIPLGALIPERVDNLLAAGKNLGVTRITNGAYRLHPVEWNTGEAAGALAAFCLDKGYRPRQVRNDPALLADFQALLSRELHVDLEWPEFGPL
jgi:hypothetical protein